MKMLPERFCCRKCGKSIDGHNQYLHDGMCDVAEPFRLRHMSDTKCLPHDCFFATYFPEDQAEYVKRREQEDG